ncbi:MAG: MBL fold metallo-hydrolase [bacterium]|nr:MAG: MBL fold metallo-hydrolase [bacterium]
MTLEHLLVGPLQSNCFIIGDEKTGKAAVIDPGGDGPEIIKRIQSKPWDVVAILNTHAHFDHIAANAELVRGTGAPLMVPQLDAALLDQAAFQARMYGISVQESPKPDRLLEDSDIIEIGGERVEVIATPGHTPGGVTFRSSLGIFSGDALFAGSIGRTDLPGGDFETLIKSIKERILALPDDTPVYPGHGPSTTVGRERQYNPFLQAF